jgi:predicted membrane protein
LIAGLIAGAVLGAVSAGLVWYTFGTNAGVTRLAVTVAIASLLGGATAILPRAVHAAALCAMLGTLVLGLLFSRLQTKLMHLFGATDTLSSQANASWVLAYLQAAAAGIMAGLFAFWFLRRYGTRAWPWYLLAGALAGLLLLISELVTRTGGASLIDAVRGFSEGDRLAVDFEAYARLRNAMIVTFIGGIAAMIAVGRTLRAATADDAD